MGCFSDSYAMALGDVRPSALAPKLAFSDLPHPVVQQALTSASDQTRKAGWQGETSLLKADFALAGCANCNGRQCKLRTALARDRPSAGRVARLSGLLALITRAIPWCFGQQDGHSADVSKAREDKSGAHQA